MPRSHTLILTATITPPSGVPHLVRTDPAQRRDDYMKAFEFYLKIPARILPRIVFAENSNSDVAPFRDLASRIAGDKEVFVTSHEGLNHPASHGRGYGEFKLLDRIMSEFEPVASLPADSVIWKGTGRYRLVNLPRMIATEPSRFDLYCDMKNRPIPWFDMRFFACTPSGYRRLLAGRYPDFQEDLPCNGPLSSEVKLRKFMEAHLDDPGIVPRFRVEPFIEGISGFHGRSYVSGKNLAKYYLKTVSRAVAPGLWI